MTRMPRRLLIAVLTFTVLVIGVITLSPTRLDRPIRRFIINAIAVVNDAHILPRVHYSLFEHLANVAIFVPVGVVLALLLPRLKWWIAPIVASAGSLCVEIIQALSLPDRIASGTDVVLNTTGALIGAVIIHRMSLRAQQNQIAADDLIDPTPTHFTLTP